MPKRDPGLTPIELIEEGKEWQIWKHYDTSGSVVLSQVIIFSHRPTLHIIVIAQDDDISSRPGAYVRALIEGMNLIGKDWFLELFGSRPLGWWCAEGKDFRNILRLQ